MNHHRDHKQMACLSWLSRMLLLLISAFLCSCGPAADEGHTGAIETEAQVQAETETETKDAELLSFSSISDLPDGNYWIRVKLEGGSGRASIASPTGLYVKDGKASADIHWSSAGYDYMRVDGETYTAFSDVDTGNSVMTIPVTELDTPIEVTADTTAMSKPYEIDYTLTFYGSGLLKMTGENDHRLPPSGVQEKMQSSVGGEEAGEDTDAANASETPSGESGPDWTSVPEIAGLSFCGTDANDAAVYFRLSHYQDTEGRDYRLLEIAGGAQRFLLVPAGAGRSDFTAYAAEDHAVNREKAGDAIQLTVLQQPLSKVYVAASAVMAPICDIGAVSQLRFSGLSADRWYVEAAREAMESGQMLFAGKYSEPDFETLLQEGCSLAMESTMIYHVPEVKEKLEALGIPVYVDYSSYEPHVLGRIEWLRVYGALFGCEEKAAQFYQSQREGMQALQQETSDAASRPSVVYFYINTAGQVQIRQPKDYIPELLEMAGACYLYKGSSSITAGSLKSYITVSAEDFYRSCRDADYLIYSATLDRPLSSVSELLGKSALLSDFKAVKSGHVYTTNKDFYQLSDRMADFAEDVRHMLQGEDDELQFLKKVT